MGIVLLILGFYFSFKFKQAVGRGRRNDILANFGGGSFLEGVVAGFFRLIYGILALACIVGGLASFGDK